MDFMPILFSVPAGTALIVSSALLLAFGIDRYLGEPPVRWHPVVWIGNYLGWVGRRLAPPAASGTGLTAIRPDFKRFWLGALAWCAGIAIVFIVSWWLQYALLSLPNVLGPLPGGVLAALGLGLALKPMLAWAMLRREAQAVEVALGQSLPAGRERLSWLVSRDVTQLTEAQVRESAIETLAENLNDSVVAPLFWFVLLGLPGAALYRFANTADAMWGYPGVYQGRNWAWAGKWAARADDGLSWLPARLTAMLLALVSGAQCADGTPGAPQATSFLSRLRAEAARTPSPNSGWPMAAMALALDVSLHKPGVYVLNAGGKAPKAPDLSQAIVYASKVVVVLVAAVLVATLLIAFGVYS